MVPSVVQGDTDDYNTRVWYLQHGVYFALVTEWAVFSEGVACAETVNHNGGITARLWW